MPRATRPARARDRAPHDRERDRDAHLRRETSEQQAVLRVVVVVGVAAEAEAREPCRSPRRRARGAERPPPARTCERSAERIELAEERVHVERVVRVARDERGAERDVELVVRRRASSSNDGRRGLRPVSVPVMALVPCVEGCNVGRPRASDLTRRPFPKRRGASHVPDHGKAGTSAKSFERSRDVHPSGSPARRRPRTSSRTMFPAYVGRQERTAFELMRRSSQDDCCTFLTMSGAMTPAGLHQSCLIPLIERGLVDCLTTTGANLYHDAHRIIGHRIREIDPNAGDLQYRLARIIRIYDLGFWEETLLETDKLFSALLLQARVPEEDDDDRAALHARPATSRRSRRRSASRARRSSRRAGATAFRSSSAPCRTARSSSTS